MIFVVHKRINATMRYGNVLLYDASNELRMYLYEVVVKKSKKKSGR